VQLGYQEADELPLLPLVLLVSHLGLLHGLEPDLVFLSSLVAYVFGRMTLSVFWELKVEQLQRVTQVISTWLLLDIAQVEVVRVVLLLHERWLALVNKDGLLVLLWKHRP
jgi:hypothetical protein